MFYVVTFLFEMDYVFMEELAKIFVCVNAKCSLYVTCYSEGKMIKEMTFLAVGMSLACTTRGRYCP